MKLCIYKNGENELTSGVAEYIQILDFNNVQYVITDIHDKDFWQHIEEADLFIFKTGITDHYLQLSADIIPIAEKNYGKKCFPDVLSRYLYDDKIREYFLLSGKGYPICKSWAFYNKEKAKDFLRGCTFPLVMKLKGGASSANVELLENRDEATKYVDLMFGPGIDNNKGLPGSLLRDIKDRGIVTILRKSFGEWRRKKFSSSYYHNASWMIDKNYILFQEFMPGNTYDSRVVVIGNKSFAFRRFNRVNDFRASGTDQVSHDPKFIDKEFIRIAFDISKTFGFSVMSYDFMYDEDKKPSLVELSYHYGSDSIAGSKAKECPGYWDENLLWHDEQIDPRYLELAEITGLSDLRKLAQ